jgi:hypothetical protein
VCVRGCVSLFRGRRRRGTLLATHVEPLSPSRARTHIHTRTHTHTHTHTQVQHYRSAEEARHAGGFVFKLGRASEVLGVDFGRFRTRAHDGHTETAQAGTETAEAGTETAEAGRPPSPPQEQPHTIRYEHTQ